jgi:hypothetical protein
LRLDIHESCIAAAHVFLHRELRARQLLRHRHEVELAGHRVVAGVGAQVAAQQREQAGLAATVAADDPDLVAAEDGQVGAVEEHRSAASQAQIPKFEHGMVQAWGRAF